MNKETKAENFKFICNRECEYFPCHSVPDKEEFNCLFCYCPLYALGSGCGGNFVYLENGVKDCSGCIIPHTKGAYEYVTSKYNLIKDLAKENR